MHTPKISIIVPVYKAEKYLHRCVDSIISQTMQDFEVLLINDGSPDRSGEICDEYAVRDERIKVVHQQNAGVSSARQKGLDKAQGEYVIHADPDDWVESNMFEELYKKAKEENADMVICDFFINTDKKQIYSSQLVSTDNHNKVLSELLLQNIHGSCCNKLIKSEIIRQYNLKFPQEISLWEDLFFNCNLLLYDIKISYLDKAFYHYDKYSNSNSIVRTQPNINKIKDMIFFIDFFEKNIPVELYTNLNGSKVVAKEHIFTSMKLNANKYYKIYPEITYRDYLKYTKTNWYSPIRIGIIVSYSKCYKISRVLYNILHEVSTFLKEGYLL